MPRTRQLSKAEKAQKAWENRLRRMAQRQGFVLEKSGRRDPYAPDFNRWWIKSQRGSLKAGGSKGLTLEEVESWLKGNR